MCVGSRWNEEQSRNRVEAGTEWKDERNPEFVIGNAFVSATCDIVNKRPASDNSQLGRVTSDGVSSWHNFGRRFWEEERRVSINKV